MDTYGEEGAPTLNIFYLCKPHNNPRFVHDDIADYQWFPLSDLPKKIAFESAQKALAQLTPLHYTVC